MIWSYSKNNDNKNAVGIVPRLVVLLSVAFLCCTTLSWNIPSALVFCDAFFLPSSLPSSTRTRHQHDIFLSVSSSPHQQEVENNIHDDDECDSSGSWKNRGDSAIRSRRSMLSVGLGAVVTSTMGCVLGGGVKEASAATMPPTSTTVPMLGGNRVEGMGGGFDLLTIKSLKESDSFYPQSCVTGNDWNVKRVVTSVEGDAGQAAVCWKALGGPDSNSNALLASQKTEVYQVRFVPSPNINGDATYNFDGKTFVSSVLDRGFEITNRNEAVTDVSWNADQGGDLSYTITATDKKPVTMELKVMQRKNSAAATTNVNADSTATSNNNGWGSDELIRIHTTSSGGGMFGDLYRAARVKRRFRRGFDETTGERIIDGLEIVTTYRVLDGIAGIEMPTSTTKSRIRMTAAQQPTTN